MLHLKIEQRGDRFVFGAWRENEEEPFYQQILEIRNAGQLDLFSALATATAVFSNEALHWLIEKTNKKTNPNPAG